VAGRKGLKIVLFAVVPVLLIGSVAVLGKLGIVPIPGLSPTKPKALAGAAALYGEPKDAKTAPVAKKELPKPKPKPAETPLDLDTGAKKVAKLWNEIETDRLVKMVATWPDPDLARILTKMNLEKSTALLAALDPKRASKLSEEILKQASVVAQAP